MALFNQVVITKRGRQLIADATASQKHITFTTVKTGAGVYNGNENLQEATDLLDEKNTYPIVALSTVSGDTVKLRSQISNQNVTVGYTLTEYGVYAKLDNGAEILFGISTAQSADFFPAYANSPVSILLEMYLKFANANTIHFDFTVPGGIFADAVDVQELTIRVDRINRVQQRDLQTKEVLLLAEKWQQEGNVFKQEVVINGVTAGDNPILVRTIDGIQNPTDVKVYNKNFNYIYSGVTNTNTAIFYAYKRPLRSLKVGLKGV
jgi:hypothetical protein